MPEMLTRRRFMLTMLATAGTLSVACGTSAPATPTSAPKPTDAPKPAAPAASGGSPSVPSPASSPATAASPATSASPAASPSPAAAASSAPAAQAAPASKPTQTFEVATQLGWLRNGEFAPIMVADAKGYFADEGIKHRILDGGPGKNPVPIVGAGQADFGITAGGNSVFQARVAPDPVDVIAIGTLLQVGPYSYITLANPNDPEPKPKDLEGKTFGMQADGDFYLQAFAKKNGLDLSKIKVEIVQATAEPLLVGKVDYFTGWITNQTYQIDQEVAKPDAPPNLKGKVWKAMRYADYAVPSYSDVLFATAKTIKEKPDLVRGYVRAVARAMQFILDNSQPSIDLVAAYPEQIEKADKLAWRWNAQNPLFVSDDTKKNGLLWMNAGFWDQTIAFYKEYNQIPRIIPAAEMMTNDFIPSNIRA
jgi:ABC-type nitrate/sulfonate/bicarbonate transport system substrate-binding protein